MVSQARYSIKIEKKRCRRSRNAQLFEEIEGRDVADTSEP